MMLPAFAAERRLPQVISIDSQKAVPAALAIDISCRTALSSKSAARRCYQGLF